MTRSDLGMTCAEPAEWSWGILPSLRRIIQPRSWMRLARCGFGGVGQGVGQYGHDGGVFAELARVDLVEGVGRGVVVVEVEAAVLDGREAGHAFLGQAVDVFAGFGGAAGVSAPMASRTWATGRSQSPSAGLPA